MSKVGKSIQIVDIELNNRSEQIKMLKEKIQYFRTEFLADKLQKNPSEFDENGEQTFGAVNGSDQTGSDTDCLEDGEIMDESESDAEMDNQGQKSNLVAKDCKQFIINPEERKQNLEALKEKEDLPE